jgi:hypothetical protein
VSTFHYDPAPALKKWPPQGPSEAEAPRTRFCRKCGKPGVYVRTRYFENCSSDVWECQTAGCENHNLIWHTDTPRGERSPVVDKVLGEG